MTNAVRKVKTIPAKTPVEAALPSSPVRRRRVAAYARVSTDKDEQLSSYESQVDYYTRYIQGRDDWEFAGVYTDEGITGTSTKHREGFKSMVAAALAGEIDLIVTKSVSRFARNTVDSLTTIRELKDAGVEVYFEKENIWTFDGKGELLITIMSSLAQEESRSISENCKWGKRKLLAEGHVWVPYNRFLGYDKGPNGELVVNPEQAALVRRIFSMFLQGKSVGEIARTLTAEGARTGSGCTRWHWGAVKGILTNEKYKGDALLQKTFIPDFLNKKQVKNTGQVPQYYVEGNHEAIIEPEVFDEVQREMERRRGSQKKEGAGPFSGRVRCGVCGANFGRKIWHSTSNPRYVFQCNGKYATKPPCPSTHLYQEELEEAVSAIMCRVLSSKKRICNKVRRAIESALDASALEAEHEALLEKMERARERVDACVADNASRAQDQEGYEEHYRDLADAYESIAQEARDVEAEIERRKGARTDALAFIAALEKAPRRMKGVDEALWYTLVDYTTVHADKSVTITFKGGLEMGLEG